MFKAKIITIVTCLVILSERLVIFLVECFNCCSANPDKKRSHAKSREVM